ncbi:MAG: hypothetical protein ACJA2Y_001169 [Cycloclasticus pugetii]
MQIAAPYQRFLLLYGAVQKINAGFFICCSKLRYISKYGVNNSVYILRLGEQGYGYVVWIYPEFG